MTDTPIDTGAPPDDDLVQQYADQCAQMAAEEEEFLADTVAQQLDDQDDTDLTDDFVEICLNNNERGDGVLYARLMRDQFVYDKSREKKPWLHWAGHHWQIDTMGLHIEALEKVAGRYLQSAACFDEPLATARTLRAKAKKEADSATTDETRRTWLLEVESHEREINSLVKRQSKFLKRVDRLRGKAGAEKTVWWAHHIKRPLAIDGSKILDEQRMQAAASNGVIDLYSGQLHPGRPQDYHLSTLGVPYPVEIDSKRIMRYLETGKGMPELDPWTDFITQIHSHDPDGRDDGSGVPQFFHKLAGYSLLGDKKHHLFVIAAGGGRNGKGTFFRTTRSIFGDYYWTIKSDLLIDTKMPRNTAGPSPEIMAMRHKRIVVASEVDQHRHIACAAVKEYSGGDDLNARSLFGDEINYIPTHILWMQTNPVPIGVLKDFALRQRAIIFDMIWRYVYDIPAAIKKEPHLAPYFRLVDPDLEKRFHVMRSIILLWYLRGAILMQQEGPNIPARVRADMDERQLLEDNLEQFLRTNCLQDFDPDREYNEGEQTNIPDEEQPGSLPGLLFISRADSNKGHPPVLNGDDPYWKYGGPHGINPAGWMLFKEFYDRYRRWYTENVTDKSANVPSQKSVASDLRKKGFDVRVKGGPLKIFGGLKVINFAE